MKTIKFNVNSMVENGQEREVFTAGQVVTMNDFSAEHWVRRGKADYCEQEVEKAPAADATKGKGKGKGK